VNPWWGVLVAALLCGACLTLAWFDYSGPDDHE
jgi:hypothetical protein